MEKRRTCRILVAPNAMKGSLSAAQAAEAMAAGARRAAAGAEIVTCPVADGGDGLVEVLRTALAGDMIECGVSGPLGIPLCAAYLWSRERGVAVIEMAQASGLARLPAGAGNPLATTTFGTGELICDALKRGAGHLVLGLGGSATNDCGLGAAAALGLRFTDKAGRSLLPVGGSLGQVAAIDRTGLNPGLKGVRLEVMCDVANPLLGPRGATRVFGPQKGATAEQVESLEAGMAHMAEVILRETGRDVGSMPGGGAAGGLAAGLAGFFGAVLRPGTDVVLDLLGFDRLIEGTSLVLTAEGSLDEQTLAGKAPAGVARRSVSRGVPCFAIAGRVTGSRAALHAAGFSALFSLCDGPMTLAQATEDSFRLLEAAAEEAVRAFVAGG